MTLSQMRTRISALLGVIALVAGSAVAAPAQMTNMGPEDGSKQISITVWLNLHNKGESGHYGRSDVRHEFTELSPFSDDEAGSRSIRTDCGVRLVWCVTFLRLTI